MKKLWAVLLCFVLLFAMTACGNSAPAASSENESTEAIRESTSEATEDSESTEEINGTNESDEVVLEEVFEVKTAVVCFSGTGNTMAVAETIADVTGGDLFEIIPAEKYADEDLNYNDDNCRANKEQDDPDARPAIENNLSAVEEYDTIYLGQMIGFPAASADVKISQYENDSFILCILFS